MLTTVTVYLHKTPFQLGARGTFAIIDPQSDVVLQNGQMALTWRRFGQDLPDETVVQYLHTYREDEHPDAITRSLVDTLIHQLPQLNDEVIIEAATELVASITRAKFEDDNNWQYRHSPAYFQRVYDYQFGGHEPLASWERELLNSGGASH